MSALEKKRIAFVGAGLMGGILIERLLGAYLRDQVTVALTCDDPDCRANHIVQLAEIYQAVTRLLCPACRSEWSGLRSPAYRENRERTHVVAPD